MRIRFKALQDKKLGTYKYTILCRKCGYSTEADMLERDEIKIAQMPCPKCAEKAKIEAKKVVEQQKIEAKEAEKREAERKVAEKAEKKAEKVSKKVSKKKKK